MGNLSQIGQIHDPDLPQQTWDQQQNVQNKANVTHTLCITCATIAGQVANQVAWQSK
jgi:hypothetical protein